MEASKTLGHAHCASAKTYIDFMPGFMTFHVCLSLQKKPKFHVIAVHVRYRSAAVPCKHVRLAPEMQQCCTQMVKTAGRGARNLDVSFDSLRSVSVSRISQTLGGEINKQAS